MRVSPGRPGEYFASPGSVEKTVVKGNRGRPKSNVVAAAKSGTMLVTRGRPRKDGAAAAVKWKATKRPKAAAASPSKGIKKMTQSGTAPASSRPRGRPRADGKPAGSVHQPAGPVGLVARGRPRKDGAATAVKSKATKRPKAAAASPSRGIKKKAQSGTAPASSRPRGRPRADGKPAGSVARPVVLGTRRSPRS